METSHKKGLIFRTDDKGQLVLDIHPQTAIEFLQNLPVDRAGWTQYVILANRSPKNGITHRMVCNRPELGQANYEYKPLTPEEAK